MFSDDVDEDETAVASAAAAATKASARRGITRATDATLHENWDDAQGYYKVTAGEVLHSRYRVLGTRGKGVFSTVAYARDLKFDAAAAAAAAAAETAAARQSGAAGDGAGAGAGAGIPTSANAATGVADDAQTAAEVESAAAEARAADAAASRGGAASDEVVAVKFIRANDVMRRAGQKELDLLRKIQRADPQGRHHVVRLLDSFEHRAHLCLVFEALHMNMKEVADKFGKGVGIKLAAVRMYTRQMLLALRMLHRMRIVHADIKLQNMLCDDRWSTLKLADFGSGFGMDDPDNVPTPYLVSRFYRAPDIMLGLDHSPALDMWSVACCIYELFTGAVLFNGDDNNDMLWLHMQVKGPFPNKIVRRHIRASVPLQMEPHFGEDLRFIKHELDAVTHEPSRRYVTILRPTKDLGRMLLAKKGPEDDKRHVLHLRDMLESMLVLDPSKRLSVEDALAHPFVTGKAPERRGTAGGAAAGAAARQ